MSVVLIKIATIVVFHHLHPHQLLHQLQHQAHHLHQRLLHHQHQHLHQLQHQAHHLPQVYIVNNYIDVCTGCKTGYYLSSGSCIKTSVCPHDVGCSTCNTNTTCSVCLVGYYLNSSKKCIKCSNSNCSTCKLSCKNKIYIDHNIYIIYICSW